VQSAFKYTPIQYNRCRLTARLKWIKECLFRSSEVRMLTEMDYVTPSDTDEPSLTLPLQLHTSRASSRTPTTSSHRSVWSACHVAGHTDRRHLALSTTVYYQPPAGALNQPFIVGLNEIRNCFSPPVSLDTTEIQW